MTTVYRCWFNYNDARVAVTGTEGACEFKDGFWITGTMHLTKGKDAQYWIPPSQITLIEKGVVL